jgi:hypothetical protein
MFKDVGVPMRTLVWQSDLNFIVREAMMLITRDRTGTMRTTRSNIQDTHIL